MKKVTKKIWIALTLATIVALSITGAAMAAGSQNGDCSNDSICPYGGDGPADGTGLQKKMQANVASSNQNQFNNQFNANGNCNANKYSNTYRHGYGLITE